MNKKKKKDIWNLLKIPWQRKGGEKMANVNDS